MDNAVPAFPGQQPPAPAAVDAVHEVPANIGEGEFPPLPVPPDAFAPADAAEDGVADVAAAGGNGAGGGGVDAQLLSDLSTAVVDLASRLAANERRLAEAQQTTATQHQEVLTALAAGRAGPPRGRAGDGEDAFGLLPIIESEALGAAAPVSKAAVVRSVLAAAAPSLPGGAAAGFSPLGPVLSKPWAPLAAGPGQLDQQGGSLSRMTPVAATTPLYHAYINNFALSRTMDAAHWPAPKVLEYVLVSSIAFYMGAALLDVAAVLRALPSDSEAAAVLARALNSLSAVQEEVIAHRTEMGAGLPDGERTTGGAALLGVFRASAALRTPVNSGDARIDALAAQLAAVGAATAGADAAAATVSTAAAALGRVKERAKEHATAKAAAAAASKATVTAGKAVPTPRTTGVPVKNE